MNLICVGSFSQNLIRNSSFEDTTLRTTPLFLPLHWDAPTNEGPNYYTPLHNDEYPNWGTPNNVNGFQYARTGAAYIGIRVYDLYKHNRSRVREYIQIQLKEPLIQDSTYCLQLYTSMADSIWFASRGQMGVYLSSTAVSANHRERLPYTPQIILSPDSYITEKDQWVKIEHSYTANGGEEYFTLGNFNDTTLQDTQFVYGGGDKFFYEASYYYYDDIYFGSCDSVPEDTTIGLRKNALEGQLKVYPNPAGNYLNLAYNGSEQLRFRLLNVLGQVQRVAVNQGRGQYQFSLVHLPEGIYILEVMAGEERISRKIIKQ